jgi:hypothetical protein
MLCPRMIGAQKERPGNDRLSQKRSVEKPLIYNELRDSAGIL